MNPRRFAKAAAVFCQMALAGGVVAWLAGFGSPSIENTSATPIVDRRAASLAANVQLAGAPQATAKDNPVVANADVVTAIEPAAQTDAETKTAASDQPEPIVDAALTDSSQTLPPEIPAVQVATVSTPDPVAKDANEAVSSIEILDECLVADPCIDRYLWALYERTPKEDTIKVNEQRKVEVNRCARVPPLTLTTSAASPWP